MSDSEDGRSPEETSSDPFEDTVVEILGFDGEADAAAEQPATAGPEEADPTVAADVRGLQVELEAQKDRFVRLRADFDNFRKRAERERGEIERYALVEPVRELLPVVDNLERALAATAPHSGGEDLRKGVEMILRQLHELLRRFGLSALPAVGERFDPSVHEAVAHESSADVEAPTVIAEFQRGYRLSERLLRPSLVRVAMPEEPAEGLATKDAGTAEGA